MNRRIFLAQPILCYPLETTRHINKPVMLDSKDNIATFRSFNGKLIINTNYVDNNDNVLVITNKSWYDPISKMNKTKVDKELFILDYDNL